MCLSPLVRCPFHLGNRKSATLCPSQPTSAFWRQFGFELRWECLLPRSRLCQKSHFSGAALGRTKPVQTVRGTRVGRSLPLELEVTHSVTHTRTHFHTCTHNLSHTLSLTYTHIISLSLTQIHAHTRIHSLTHSCQPWPV